MSSEAKVIGVYSVEAVEPVYLVEIEIKGSTGKFDLIEITQEVPGQPRSNWQVPYDERILDESGSMIKADSSMFRDKPEDWIGNIRIAFFFHYLELNQALKTPFGKLSLPSVSAKPVRLSFMEYDPPF